MIIWLKPSNAPKCGRPILAQFYKEPYPVVCVWNEPNEEWCTAEVKSDIYQGKFNDHHFENEYQKPEALMMWADIFSPTTSTP